MKKTNSVTFTCTWKAAHTEGARFCRPVALRAYDKAAGDPSFHRIFGHVIDEMFQICDFNHYIR